MPRKSRHAPGEMVDLAYIDGYRWITLYGHLDETTAAKLAADFVVDARKEAGDPWFVTERYALTSFGQKKPTEPNLYRCVRCKFGAEVEHRFMDSYWEAFAPDTCPSCKADCAEEPKVPRYGRVRHRWATWGFADPDGDYGRIFYDHHTAGGRGRCPITVVEDLDEREADDAKRAEGAARAERLRIEVEQRYPEATEVNVHPYGIDEVDVAFKMPGLTYWVHADSRLWPGAVEIAQGDLGVWEATYAGRSVEGVQRG